MQNQEYLKTEKLSKLMLGYALPCIISLLVGALYNIVDQIFIANADYLASNGNAANTAVFPLTVIALAVAVMIGDGCCSFVSIKLGEGDPKNAGKSVGNAISLSIICGIIICAVYLIIDDWLITIFGGNVNEETFAFAKEYFLYIAIGIPFYVFGQAINPIIRADGSPKFAMITTLAGAIVNIILDPIFIFACHWGMMGAAVATVLGQVVTAVAGIWYLFRMKIIKLHKRDFLFDGKVLGKTLSLGICSFLAQISLVIAMLATNNMITKYGLKDEIFGQEQYSQIPMAVFGIVMKVFQIIISITIGLAAGCIPIAGYNMGAKAYKRVKSLLTILLIAEAIVGAISLLVVELLPNAILNIFGANQESEHYRNFGLRCFRIYLSMIIFACVNKAAFIFLQATGKAIASTTLSMIREILLGVTSVLILPLFFGLDGVLYSMPLADILTFIISCIVLFFTYKNLTEKEKQQLSTLATP